MILKKKQTKKNKYLFILIKTYYFKYKRFFSSAHSASIICKKILKQFNFR